MTMDYKHRSVAIIGAGMSGLCAAARLRQRFGRSVDITVFESAPTWGGTWYHNTYPGVACDTPVHVYSFSWFRKTDWKRHFALGAEVHEYFTELIDAHDLRNSIRVNTEVTAANYDAQSSSWILNIVDKSEGSKPTFEEGRFDFMILASGSQKNLVEPPEMANFKGVKAHTAKWDANIDLIGKNVAIVGVGASAAQVICAIQPVVKELHVYQRNPQWVFPRDMRDDIPSWLIKIFVWFPFIYTIYRAWVVWKHDIVVYRAFSKDHWVQKIFTFIARKHISSYFGSRSKENGGGTTDLVEAMTPKYSFGCKRIIISGSYYAAISKPNVRLHHGSLVGVEGGTTIVSQSATAQLDRSAAPNDEKTPLLSGGAVVPAEKTKIERTPVDVLICATGFDYQLWMRPLYVYGRSRVQDLGEAWMDKSQTYYGLATAGYPNSFSLLGPGSRPGHTGICGIIEPQVDHMADLIAHMMQNDIRTVEVTPEAQRRATQYVADSMRGAVYGTGCAGWYQNKQGQVTVAWPNTAWDYARQLRKVNLADWSFS